MQSKVSAFVCGLLFSLGLLVAEMANPQKVLNFLDVAGRWDPSLALVMLGALLTLGVVQRYIVFRRGRPLYDEKFHLPNTQVIDKSLVYGALIFGVGWGLLGFCPGPAIVAMTINPLPGLVFVLAMGLGMHLANWLKQARNK